MKSTTTLLVIGGLLLIASQPRGVLAESAAASVPEVEIDKPAPDFTLTDTEGKAQTLSAHRGEYVVLEWTNFDCPFVRKHYDTGNMQKLQKSFAEKGVVWFRICSSAEGKQGFYSAEEINEKLAAEKSKSAGYLIDSDGAVGRKYGAKTTPHMFVVDPEGILIYAGGIDDKPSTKTADVKAATNYVAAALENSLNGKPVAVRTSTPYGCSVKYKEK
jgi:peroxiredoxin